MKSVYRFMGTTEGRKNGLLQMKRLTALLRKAGIPYTMKELPMPASTLPELMKKGYNVQDWWGRSVLREERPTTYFEVTFDESRSKTATT